MRITAAVICGLLLLAPNPSLAQEGMRFDDPFGQVPAQSVCWRMFALIPERARPAMAKALQAAGERTRPARAGGVPVVQAQAESAACAVVVSGARRRRRTAAGFVHDVWVEQGETRVVERSAGPLWPLRAEAEDFEEVFEAAWALAAPRSEAAAEAEPSPDAVPETDADRTEPSTGAEAAPSRPAEPSSNGDEPFVDEDLAAARSEAVEGAPPPSQPWVTVLATGGLTSRDLRASFGRSVEPGLLPALGARVTLHLAPILGPKDALDVSAGYWRQIPSVELDGQSLDTEADRTRVDVGYAHRFGAGGPFLGAALGFEYRRFDYDERSGAASIQYSILRPGLSVRQRLFTGTTTHLELLGRGHLRIGLDDGSISNDVGTDFGGGLAFGHRVGLVVQFTVDYTLQSGRGAQGRFDDAFLDGQLALGWTF